MSLDTPVNGEKIWGFGAFEQLAEFFFYDARRNLAEHTPFVAEDTSDFVKQLRVMVGLFDVKYVHKKDLHPALHQEKEAWQLLRHPMMRWLDALTAHLNTPEDLQAAAALLDQGAVLMKQWGIISQSFKAKLESLRVEEAAIQELILELRRKVTEALSGQ